MFKLNSSTPFILTLMVLLLFRHTAVFAETIIYDGLIEPNMIVEIGAPAEGIIADVAVDRSTVVEKGQVLVSLESSLERASLEKAQAMEAFKGEIGLLHTQLAFAKRAHKRIKKLAAISPQEKDEAATSIQLTQNRLKKAWENRTLAKLEHKKAQVLLARRTIKSPIKGVVVARYVSPGEYVNSQPLLRLAQIDPLRVEVIVPAQMFGRIRPGMVAVVVPELAEFGERTATVTIVDRVIDAASSTFGVRLELPNSEKQMPSGLRCQVRFEIDANPDGKKKITAGRLQKQALK